LKPEDWKHWGQFTTFKANASELLRRELRAAQSIYCSPLVDPYQPAEAETQMMPRILDALIASPPRVFVVQTRGPLVLRDLGRLLELAGHTRVRVSVSITTNREEVRRLYEPLCASIDERLRVIRALRETGIETYATLAPLLPCDPEALARAAIEASGRDLIGDPLHIRAVKRHGATTRAEGWRVSEKNGFEAWLDADFQAGIIERIERAAGEMGKTFLTGPRGFARLAK
jgi:DNA repair photolyase